MDVREMIESVVQEVIGTMKREEKKLGKVLFVFCDSTAHESFKDLFIELDNAKIGYDCLFLDGETSSWLGMNQVESFGSGKIIASDENAPAPIELPKKYDGLIIPEIDLDNASRIASGMKGSIKAELIFSALLLEKFVLIGDENPGLKRADRRSLNKLELPAAYQRMFKAYINQMKDLGIKFVDLKKVGEELCKYLNVSKLKTEKRSSENKTDTQNQVSHKLAFSKKLLTADWVASLGNVSNENLYLSKKTIISPLARDLIKEKNLTVKILD